MELSRSNSLTATGEERGEWIEEAEGRLLDELMSRAADLRIAATRSGPEATASITSEMYSMARSPSPMR